MNELNGFKITKRDRVLRAWQVSTGLVREYRGYADEIQNEDKGLALYFNELAEKEAEHSAKLREILKRFEK